MTSLCMPAVKDYAVKEKDMLKTMEKRDLNRELLVLHS